MGAEHLPPAKTASCGFRLTRLTLQEGHQAPAFFYGKLTAGLIAYNDNSGEKALPLDAMTVSRIMEFMRITLNGMGIANNDDDFVKLWQRANKPEDSPWNKAKDWMTETEAPLYARYAEVADALHRAGESGTDQEKAKARADFADWLRAVQKMSD